MIRTRREGLHEFMKVGGTGGGGYVVTKLLRVCGAEGGGYWIVNLRVGGATVELSVMLYHLW